MSYQTTRREALTFIAGVAPLGGARRAESATTKGPQDFVIVEGLAIFGRLPNAPRWKAEAPTDEFHPAAHDRRRLSVVIMAALPAADVHNPKWQIVTRIACA